MLGLKVSAPVATITVSNLPSLMPSAVTSIPVTIFAPHLFTVFII